MSDKSKKKTPNKDTKGKQPQSSGENGKVTWLGPILFAVVFGVLTIFTGLEGHWSKWWAKFLIIPGCALAIAFCFGELIRHLGVVIRNAVISGIILFVIEIFIAVKFYPSPEVPKNDPSKTTGYKWKTLRELFANDPDGFSVAQDVTIRPYPNSEDKDVHIVTARLIFGYAARAKYMSFYVPLAKNADAVCLHLAGSTEKLLKEMETGLAMTTRSNGDIESESSTNLIFSGRVFLYFENELTLEQLAEIKKTYASKNLSVVLRGSEFASGRNVSAESEVLRQNLLSNPPK